MDARYFLTLTGHTHVNSPFETYSDCGNCDGARCYKCKEVYDVYDVDEWKFKGRYDSKEEAERRVRELETS